MLHHFFAIHPLQKQIKSIQHNYIIRNLVREVIPQKVSDLVQSTNSSKPTCTSLAHMKMLKLTTTVIEGKTDFSISQNDCPMCVKTMNFA